MQQCYVAVLLLSLLLLIAFVISSLSAVIGTTSKTIMPIVPRSAPRTDDVQIVVARYGESLDFLSYHPFNKCAAIVYNKGRVIKSEYPMVNLPNIGRCDHTYLYHVVKNYDTLAPVTLFIPGSCMDRHKQYKAYGACALALSTRTSVFPGKIFEPSVAVAERNFVVDKYTASNPANRRENPESTIQPATIRPFGKWYNEHFSTVDNGTKVACLYGIFAVSREHIRQHPVSYYQTFLDQLSVGSNPEVGHYMERSWATLFYPYPESCVYPMDM